MKLKRKLLAAIMIAGLAGAGLTACSSSGSSGDGKSLVIWQYEDANSAQGQAWRLAVKNFKKDHPDVKVTFSNQSFASGKTSAKVLLSGNKVPDVMEFNKGAAGVGQLASLGLLDPLDEYVKKYDWTKTLNNDSYTQMSKYNNDGVPGSGKWYGIPNYGEYLLWYYNKDYFAQHNLQVPKTQAELTELMQKIKDDGTTPVSAAAKEFPYMQTWFQYVLQNAPKDWTKCYQLFQCKVDFNDSYWKDGTKAAEDAVAKGYVANNISGITHEQMGTNFLQQKNPLMMSGSWWYGRLAKESKFDFGTFPWPQQSINQGGVGNLWVVPAHAKNKDLAAEFINETLKPDVQTLMADQGGLPVAGDLTQIKDDRTKQFTQDFQDFAARNAFGFYPDLPIPGLLDDLLSDSQQIANQSKTPEQVVTQVEKSYDTGRKGLESGK